MERYIIGAFVLSCILVGMYWVGGKLYEHIESRYAAWWMKRHPGKARGKHGRNMKYVVDNKAPLWLVTILAAIDVAALTFFFSIALAARAGYIS